MPDPEKLARQAERSLAAACDLRVIGSNIWVTTPQRLARYDWHSGNILKEITLNQRMGNAIPRGQELLYLDEQPGQPTLTRVNLNTSDTSTEQIGPSSRTIASAGKETRSGAAKPANRGYCARDRHASAAGGVAPGSARGRTPANRWTQPKSPSKPQHLPLPAKIALPALIGNSLNQERTLAELNDEPDARRAPPSAGSRAFPTILR
jgi:hypothetical protein